MLRDPGVVRCALEGDVQGQFHLSCAKLLNQIFKVSQGAKLGQDGEMSALLCADGPGTAYVVALRVGRVVLTLAKAAANGVNGRQIKHVETHIRNVIKLLYYIAQCPMLPRLSPGPWEQFVPGRKPGSLAIYPDAQGAFVARL